jgi:hypothetical protein
MALASASAAMPPIITKQHQAYGYHWSPTIDNRDALGGVDGNKAAAGIHVAFVGDCLDDTDYFFGDGVGTVAVYPQPQKASERLTQLVGEIQSLRKQRALGQAQVCKVQGFLSYTADSLAAIYATTTGRKLIDAIAKTGRRVFIVPGGSGNNVQCVNSGSSLCWIARQMTTSNWRCVNTIQDEMLKILKQASTEKSIWVWLAKRINTMPLYSLFKAPPHDYATGFLREKKREIKSEELREWFTHGWSQVGFKMNTSTSEQYDRVSRTEFIKCAVIVALYDESAAGPGSDSNVRFRVTKDPNDLTDPNAERPPAVGLAHELIHAMYNAQGMQPGLEIYHFTTTLAEQICVGLGPWAKRSISENAIRAEWPPLGSLNDFWRLLGYEPEPLGTLVGFERKAVAARTAYDPQTSRGEILKVRQSARTI